MRLTAWLLLAVLLTGCSTYAQYAKGQGCTDLLLSWWRQEHVPCKPEEPPTADVSPFVDAVRQLNKTR